MTHEVGTISAHFQRQATPEVWAEIDELRRDNSDMEARIVALEAENRALIRRLADAQGMAPEGRGREGGPGSSELPSPVVADDAPKGELS